MESTNIKIRPGKVKETKSINETISIHYDEKGPVSIEILGKIEHITFNYPGMPKREE